MTLTTTNIIIRGRERKNNDVAIINTNLNTLVAINIEIVHL